MSGGMSIPGAFVRLSVAVALACMTLGVSLAHGQAPAPSAATDSAGAGGQPDAADPAETAGGQPEAAEPAETNDGLFADGIIIAQSPRGASVPFLLKFNDDTQLRYLNTVSSDSTFTDHLGNVRSVHLRNDITVNRQMFNFNGYVFHDKLLYSLKIWTSAGAASIVITGNLGWRFSKAFTLTAGYTGVPGSRSLVNTFPYFQTIDRTMADNFFRPGFTQGAWASGDLGAGLSYLAFVGNGLNTLNISANKIDTNLALSGSVWWEPLGPYGHAGKSRQMYDDYLYSRTPRVRVGTAFTRSREDRFSNLDQSTPDNTAIYNSDGVLTFSTGAFAPDVTVEEALYKMWAVDAGFKWRGLAVNGQHYMRWLSDFVADGPLPVESTFDQGFDLTAGYFVVPRKLQLYGRGAQVFGEFRDSNEYGGGARWYFLPTERMWLNAEVLRVNHAPYGGAFTPYTTGMNGWVPMLQAVLAF